MGVLRCIVPLNATCVEWLDREGIPYPAPPATPRSPTPAEVTDVLQHIVGYRANIDADISTGEWRAHICSTDPANPAWTVLRISDYSSDDQPHDLCFHKGFPEIVYTVVEGLSHRCGPLVVVGDSGTCPIVVSPGNSIPALLQREDAAM